MPTVDWYTATAGEETRRRALSASALAALTTSGLSDNAVAVASGGYLNVDKVASLRLRTLWTASEITAVAAAINKAVTVGVGALTSATVSNKALTSNVATLTTSAAHGFSVGNSVCVLGVGAPFDGTYTILATPSTTTFTFAKTNANVTSAAATGNAVSFA